MREKVLKVVTEKLKPVLVLLKRLANKQNFNLFIAGVLSIFICILSILLFYFAASLYAQDSNEKYYKILFGAVGFTATMAGLSLRMNNCSGNKEYFHCGRSLTFCTILFLIAIGLQYLYSVIGNAKDPLTAPKFLAKIFHDIESVKNIIRILLYYAGIPLFLYGVLKSSYVFVKLTFLLSEK